MNTNRYILDQAWQRERERLEALAVVCDPFTRGHLLAHLQNALVAANLATAEEIEAAIQTLQTPFPTAVYGPIQVSAWGQRPGA
jgi:DnaJ-domain-containing protein 1